jgi:ketosteroid isomerase-like protein
MAESLEQRVGRLEDQRAIQEVIYNFSWGTDRNHRELFLDVFTEDGILHFKPGPGVPGGSLPSDPIIGHHQLAAFYDRRQRGQDPWPKHVNVNAVIKVEGDEATAESAIIFFLERGAVPELVSTGRYLDKFRRCADGKWRIAHRIGHVDSLKTTSFSIAAGR